MSSNFSVHLLPEGFVDKNFKKVCLCNLSTNVISYGISYGYEKISFLLREFILFSLFILKIGIYITFLVK